MKTQQLNQYPKFIPEDVWKTFLSFYPNLPWEPARTVAELWHSNGERLLQEYESRRFAEQTLEETKL